MKYEFVYLHSQWESAKMHLILNAKFAISFPYDVVCTIETYLGLCQTSRVEFFAKTANG